MRDFVAIDFETANPQRVSACAVGFAVVKNGIISECTGFMVKPVGGHAPFQTKIHGIRECDTADKCDFGALFPSVEHLFDLPVIGHSLFDKQVLNALSGHFDLQLKFEYTDSASVAKQKLPNLKNHKLKTLAKHFSLPKFKHHDATEDAQACAEIFLRLQVGNEERPQDQSQEFESLATAILDDDEVDYKEACELLYWLEDHEGESAEFGPLLAVVKTSLEDGVLDEIEGDAMRAMLILALHNRNR